MISPESKPITNEQIEIIGGLVDRCDNLVAASQLPMKPEFHLQQLRSALIDIGTDLRSLYRDISGEDPWA